MTGNKKPAGITAAAALSVLSEWLPERSQIQKIRDGLFDPGLYASYRVKTRFGDTLSSPAGDLQILIYSVQQEIENSC